MDIKQLRAALAVADALSFSAAAYQLSYSTSAISKQIAALERELDIRLFERGTNSKVSRTEVCEELLPFFRRMLDEYTAMTDCICARLQHGPYSLTIGTARHIGDTGLENHLAAFLSRFPGISVNWRIGSDEKLLEWVLNRTVDLSITGMIESELIPDLDGRRMDSLLEKCRAHLEDFAFVPFFRGDLSIALRSGHPAIHNGIVTLRDLKDECFVFSDESESRIQKHEDFKQACRHEGFEPNVMEVDIASRDLLMNMIAEGSVVAPLMGRPFAVYRGVDFCPLDKVYYTVTNHIYYKHNNTSPTLQSFVHFLEKRWQE